MAIPSRPAALPQDIGAKAFLTGVGAGWRRIVQKTSTDHFRFLLLLLLIGTGLRIARMGEPITYDEAVAFNNYAAQPLSIVLGNYTFVGNHILATFFMKVSTTLFGIHLWSLRLPALLAGLLVMPLVYLFCRSMFNRYIALIALALVAASGPLVEYSALARGYSMVWLCMMCALVAGRHHAKTENTVSLLLVPLFCALGMWAVPTMAYAALMVHLWLCFYIVSLYRRTVQRRLVKVVAAFAVCLLLVMLFYSPVITASSVEQVVQHPSLGTITWKRFVQRQQDDAFALWGYFNDTAASWISVIGCFGVVYAAITSSKYRALILALVLGTVPLVLAQRIVAPPRVWTFVLPILHMGSAIAVFYLLKFIQERMFTTLGKRKRTAWACVLIVAGFGWGAMRGSGKVLERFPDASTAADWSVTHLQPGDRLMAQAPWDAPVAYYLQQRHQDPLVLRYGPEHGRMIYTLVGPADGQTLHTVLRENNVRDSAAYHMVKVEDWRRLEIFAPR